ncbi:hypothetical protein FOZ62_020099, partial [Perkinsus olseni]
SLESMGPSIESASFEELRRNAIYFESRQLRKSAGKEKRKDSAGLKQGQSSSPKGQVAQTTGRATENSSSSKQSAAAYLVEVGRQSQATTPAANAELQSGVDGA